MGQQADKRAGNKSIRNIIIKSSEDYRAMKMHHAGGLSVLLRLLSLVGLENYLSDMLGLRVDVIPREDVRLEIRKEIMEETVYV